LLALPTGLSAGLLAKSVDVGILTAAGCAVGVLLSPDLDQEGSITISESYVYVHGGFLLGVLWRGYWMIYAIAIPHRHWLSHTPGIGTLLRIAYLFAPIIATAVANGWLGALLSVAAGLWPLWLGLVISDVAHYVMDFWF
jgi:uncharacterized metal-binding protein